MSIELRALRYFVAVVEAGSLTAAAAQLRLSQPSLSVAISQLETEVGVPLLTRSSRGVEPTGAGRFLLDASSRVLGDVAEISATLSRFGAGLAGSLTIAAVPVLMWARVPRLLRDFARASPEVEVRPLDPPPWVALDLLQQNRVDLAAVLVADPRRFARRHRDEFNIADWGAVPIVAALPPELRAPDDAALPLPLRAFDAATLVLPHRTAAVPSLPESVEAAFRTHGIVPGAIRTVETIQGGMPLIEAGLAWGLLPDPDHGSLERFNVAVRPVHPAPQPLRALVLTRKGQTTDPALRRLLDHIPDATSNRV
ncbi:LysR family nitrogen assimilation transcriptional regulator [Leucobacter luti]|uniref:LysR family transcriptional regulator n=1 Tax=Leucobacter luti TaxID=340320 RepID=UPI00104723A0|nr:LysR family transcriptional regulator [Leucobacter luti]MCW2289195.1 LysR family nitrogen assimilation transcriptional regulator [Leucobacter luti]TCK39758.1 LysR family nitrogen assimilation transcriptional regulator [Leucobacter luti]